MELQARFWPLTEFELIEAYHGAEASWQSALGVFISILFAYIAVAYFVGSKLTRFQVGVVSGLYALFSLMMISALTNINQRVVELAIEIRELNPDRSVAIGGAPGCLLPNTEEKSKARANCACSSSPTLGGI